MVENLRKKLEGMMPNVPLNVPLMVEAFESSRRFAVKDFAYTVPCTLPIKPTSNANSTNYEN